MKCDRRKLDKDFAGARDSSQINSKVSCSSHVKLKSISIENFSQFNLASWQVITSHFLAER